MIALLVLGTLCALGVAYRFKRQCLYWEDSATGWKQRANDEREERTKEKLRVALLVEKQTALNETLANKSHAIDLLMTRRDELQDDKDRLKRDIAELHGVRQRLQEKNVVLSSGLEQAMAEQVKLEEAHDSLAAHSKKELNEVLALLQAEHKKVLALKKKTSGGRDAKKKVTVRRKKA